jgi:DNA-binding NtrC family response regulator
MAVSLPTQPPIEQPKHWVLVVDDEHTVCQMLTDVFTSLSLDVCAVSEAESALGQVENHSTEPLLVLADVIMPGMDGLTLARKLKGRLKHGKIVLMSGHLADSSWWPTDLRELAFLPKPFDFKALQELVTEAALFYPAKR